MTAQQKIETKLASILINKCSSWDEREDIQATYVSIFNEYHGMYGVPADEAAQLAFDGVRELHNV